MSYRVLKLAERNAKNEKSAEFRAFYLMAFENIFAGRFQFLRFFYHPAMCDAFAHDLRMLLRRHRRRCHQVFQQCDIGVVVFNETAQVA
jgi:hypothetical protein